MTTTGFAAGAYANTQRLTSLASGLATGGAASAAPIAQGGFGQFLTDALSGVAETGRKAESQAVSAAAGKANLVDVVTAVAESETAIQSLVAVRDRVIAAYEEIMRMQV